MRTDLEPRQASQNRISEITRRDIVDELLLSGEPFHGRLDLVSFLKRVWPLHEMASTDYRFTDAEGDIWQHMVNNSDWDDNYLLNKRLAIMEIPDKQFATFLETCVHPLVQPDTQKTDKLVKLFNEALVNDGFTMTVTGQKSGRNVYKVKSTGGSETFGHAYEVVLSFAGEDRKYVEEVAQTLKANDVTLFYDNYEEATLWGKDLAEHLHSVYSGSARYCVMFISKHYAEKVWPSYERRSAFERAIESKQEYILPARFDDTEIPGLRKTIHYIDLRRKTATELAELIFAKLGRQADEFIPF